MLKNFFSYLKSLFKPKEKKVYVVKLTPEILKQVDSILRKQLGEKEAQIAQLLEYIKKLEEAEKKEEAKLVSNLVKQKKKIEMKKASRRVRFIIAKKTRPRLLTYDSKIISDSTGKRLYPYLYGLELEETEELWGWNVLITDTAKGSGKWRRLEFKLPLEWIFEDAENLPAALNSGSVKIRLDSNGKYYPPEGMKEDPARSYAILKKKYEAEKAELSYEINRLSAELKKAKLREEALRAKLRDLETAVDLTNFRADSSTAFSQMAIERLKGMVKSYLNVLLAAQVSEVNRLLTERLNEELVKAFGEMKEKLGIKLTKEEEENIMEKLRTIFMENLQMFHELRLPPVKKQEGKK